MPNTLRGVKVKGQQYHFDHEYLDNNPIPTYDTDTEGFVLIAHECNLEWSSIDNVLDSSSASTGDVLMATGQGIAWRSVSGFPTYDTTYPSVDEGKVLSISPDGGLEWVAIRADGLPDGGGIGQVLGIDTDGEPNWVYPEHDNGQYIDSFSNSDLGKVLTVTSDCALGWVRILPLYEPADAGAVLTVMSNGTLEWMTPSGGGAGGESSSLPTYDTTYPSSDEGKVLSISDYGDLEWMTASMVPEIPTSSTVFSPLVLTVNDDSIEWGQIGDILYTWGSDGVLTYRNGEVMWSSVFPSYDENDAGKVLTVNNAGELEWVMPS